MKRVLGVVAVIAVLCSGLSTGASAADPYPEPPTISGRVTNMDDDGITFVTVVRLGTDAVVRREPVQGSGGTYAVHRIPPGDYRVTFTSSTGLRAWEYYPGTRDSSKAKIFHVKAGSVTKGIDASLDAGGIVKGTINYPKGSKYEYTGSSVTPWYLDGKTWREAPTELSYLSRPQPTFVVGGLPTGSYRLRYDSAEGVFDTASGFLGGTDDAASGTPVPVVGGETRSVDITPRRGGHLTGRVLAPDGTPVAGAHVQPGSPGPEDTWNLRWNDATTDSLGRYTLTGLDTGSYYLTIQPPEPYVEMYSGGVFNDFRLRGSPAPPPGAELIGAKAAQDRTWDDEKLTARGSLQGTVRDASGKPLAGIVASLRYGYTYDDTSDEVPYGPETRTTDANGHYDFGPRDHRLYNLEFHDPTGAQPDAAYGTLKRFHTLTFVPPGQRVVADVFLGDRGLRVTDLRPVVGQTVKVLVDQIPLAGGRVESWTWRRNGVTIPGARSASYTTTPSDRGKSLAVSAVVVRDDGGRSNHASGEIGPVDASRPTLRLSATSDGRGRVVLVVKGSAADVPASTIDGTITIGRVRPGTDRMGTRPMRDGSLRVTLTGQPRGKHTYTVRLSEVKNRFKASATASRAVAVR